MKRLISRLKLLLILLALGACGFVEPEPAAPASAAAAVSADIVFQSGAEVLRLASLQLNKSVYTGLVLRLAQDNTWQLESIGSLRSLASGEVADGSLNVPDGTVVDANWRPADATITIRRMHLDAKVFGNVRLHLSGNKWNWLDDMAEITALTLADYKANPKLAATETHHTVLKSAPGSGPQSFPLQLTAKNYTFCMDKQDEGADSMALVDPAGNTVVTLKAGEDCATIMATAGVYSMQHTYGGIGASKVVFVRPDAKAAAATQSTNIGLKTALQATAYGPRKKLQSAFPYDPAYPEYWALQLKTTFGTTTDAYDGFLSLNGTTVVDSFNNGKRTTVPFVRPREVPWLPPYTLQPSCSGYFDAAALPGGYTRPGSRSRFVPTDQTGGNTSPCSVWDAINGTCPPVSPVSPISSQDSMFLHGTNFFPVSTNATGQLVMGLPLACNGTAADTYYTDVGTCSNIFDLGCLYSPAPALGIYNWIQNLGFPFKFVSANELSSTLNFYTNQAYYFNNQVVIPGPLYAHRKTPPIIITSDQYGRLSLTETIMQHSSGDPNNATLVRSLGFKSGSISNGDVGGVDQVPVLTFEVFGSNDFESSLLSDYFSGNVLGRLGWIDGGLSPSSNSYFINSIRYFPKGMSPMSRDAITGLFKLDNDEVALFQNNDCTGSTIISKINIPREVSPRPGGLINNNYQAIQVGSNAVATINNKPYNQSGCIQLGSNSIDFFSANGDLKVSTSTIINIHTNGCENCNLTGAMLQNMDLTGAKLQGANLSNAHLGNSNLTNADLRFTTLKGAKMSNVNLESANLCSAKLNGQLLSGKTSGSAATLTGAHLKNVNLYGATLDGADFSNASFYSSTSGTCQPSSCAIYIRPACANAYMASMNLTNFSNAYLAGVDMSSAVATGVNFNGATLFGVSFSNAKLSTNAVNGNTANFAYAYLQGTNFTNADVSSADFTSAYTDNGTGNTCMQTLLNNEFTNFPGYKGPADDGITCIPGKQATRTCIQYTYGAATLPITGSSNTCPDGTVGPCTSSWGAPSTQLSSSSRSNSMCAAQNGQQPLCDGFAQPLNSCW